MVSPRVFAFALTLLATAMWPTHVFASWPVNGAPVHIGPGDQVFGGGPIVADGSGGVIIGWLDKSDPADLNLSALKMTASGAPDVAWPASGRSLCAAPGRQTHFWSCTDGAGGAYFVWADYRDSVLTSGDIYGTRVRADGSIAPGWPVMGLLLCNATGNQFVPTCATTSDGMVVGWLDGRAFNRYDIYAQRVDSTGAIRWADDGMPVTIGVGPPNAGFNTHPTVLLDGVFVWTDYRNDGGDVWIQSLDANGQPPVFAPNGVSVCAAPGTQNFTHAVVSGDGIYFTWQDARSGTTQTYGERLDMTLLTFWNPPSGLPIGPAAGAQQVPQVTPDGSGGAFFAWQDDRNPGSAPDIYAQHLTSAGTLAPGAWLAAGSPIALSPDIQSFVQLLADGTGGAYATFYDLRGATYTFDAMRVTGIGTDAPGWPAGGKSAYAGPGVTYPSWACLDGANGLYMAWPDSREPANGFDVYLQRLGPDSGPPTVDVPTGQGPGSMVSLLAAPNPSRGAIAFTFELASETRVELDVFDVHGRLVQIIQPGLLRAGSNRVAWSGTDATGARVAAGVYWARLRASDTIARSSKVVVLN